MPKFLSIDQSLRATGICLMTEDGVIELNGTIDTAGLDITGAILKISDVVTGVIRNHSPVYVTVEEPTRMAASPSLVPLCELFGVLRYVALTHGYLHAATLYPKNGRWLKVQNQSTMKKFALGNGGVSKDSGYLLKVFQETGLQFTDDNQADAAMHAMVARRAWRLVNGIDTKDSFKAKELSALTRIPEPKVLKMSNEAIVALLTTKPEPKPKKKKVADE